MKNLFLFISKFDLIPRSSVLIVAGILLLGCIGPNPQTTDSDAKPINASSVVNQSLQNISANISSASNQTNHNTPTSVQQNKTDNSTTMQTPTNQTSDKTNATFSQNQSLTKSTRLTIPQSIESNCVGFLVGDASEMKTIALIGAAWVRPHPGPFAWGWIEKNKGTYDFTETDQWVTEAQKNNISILATVWPFADWDQTCAQNCEVDQNDQFYPRSKSGSTNGIPAKRCKPCNTTAYAKFLTALVERYDGDGTEDMSGLVLPIRYYEIGNEPELNAPNLVFFKGTANDYVEILTVSYNAIRAACNDCKIVQGGAAGTDNNFLSFWESVYSLGGHQYYDIANIHYIGHSDRNTLNVKAFRDSMNKYGVNKPVWVTEAQYKTKDPITDSFEGALNAGASKVFFVSFKIGEMGPPVYGEYSQEYTTLPEKCR